MAVHRARHNQQMLCSAALRYRECLSNFPCNFHADELEEKMNPVKTMLLQRAPYCSLVHPAGPEPSGPSTESDITDIEVDHFNCMYMGGRRVKLSWKLPSITTPSFLAGFKILYKLVSNSPRSRYTVRVISVSAGVNGRFRTVLNLPRIGRYVFQVKPYSQHKEGNLCDPIYIYVSGGNLAMSPDNGDQCCTCRLRRCGAQLQRGRGGKSWTT
ncbi:hypothetical protein RRG08_058429 [Elysia crispata]|uniref:Fibronectin type-III domain-containing protein n=1 Tax=Elysia crispata TaxID=231223 RepID=A0AAE1DWI1_9GAST|nr:hypothetical protein RRG08_058429 [Elysia crispata]